MEPCDRKITADNYDFKILRSRARQAGVSSIYDPVTDGFSYNAYCLELKLLKELFTKEFDSLEEALDCLNDEFGSWELADAAVSLPSANGCGGGAAGGCCSSKKGGCGKGCGQARSP